MVNSGTCAGETHVDNGKVMSPAVDEPVVASVTNNGIKDWNVKQGGTSITTTALNTGFVLITIHDLPTTNNSVPIRSGPTSCAKLVTSESSRKSVNFHTLITAVGNSADVVVLLESIRAINGRFENTAYGFFLENQVAHLVVANYVRNTWSKYGLVKSMLNSSNSLTHLPDLLPLSLFLIPIKRVLVGIMEVTSQDAEIKDLKA
ncbi:hypothetical protein Tco_1131499 [Tanacetum coccineum]